MSTVTELGLTEQWIRQTFAADATLGTLVTGGLFHVGEIVADFFAPAIFFRWQGGSTLNALGAGRRVFGNNLYAIYAAQQLAGYSTDVIDTIAARINTILDGTTGELADGTILACVQEAPIALTTSKNGIYIRGVGAIWRIHAQTS